MRVLLLIAIGLALHLPASAQSIKENTVYCMKGSDENPQPYCTDATPCKTINGEVVCLASVTSLPAGAMRASHNCWQMTSDYTCMQYQDGCTTYSSDAHCTEVGARSCTVDAQGNPMLAVNPKTGECSSYTRKFSCVDPTKDQDPSYTIITRCDTTGLQNGLEWHVPTTSNARDFVQAATGMEFARELALYAQKSMDGVNGLFAGEPLTCADGYWGLKNCCKSSGGGGVTNGSWAKNLGISAGQSAFKKGAGYAVAKGSAYVYDSMLSSGSSWLSDGMIGMLDEGIFNSWGASGFGAYGIGTTAGAAGGVFGASSSVAIGNTGLYFNPYALALAVAIQVVMEVMSCEQSEKDLANMRAMDLCHYIGDYCSTELKVMGVVIACIETTSTYCCYNGLLPKAVQEGAHAQLGLSWGTPEAPNCSGLTVDQLTSIDFDDPAMQAAFEPFKKQVMDNFNANAGQYIQSGAIKSDLTEVSADSALALCQQRKKLDPSTVCE